MAVNQSLLSPGKVDMKELQQLYYLHNQTSVSTSVSNEASVTVDRVKIILRSSAEKVLGLSVWFEEQTILELGASSFDIVRLANYLENELKRFAVPSLTTGKDGITEELFQHLLEKPLSQVVAYICQSFSNETKAEGSLHSTCYSSTKKGCGESASVKKRPPLVFSAHDQPLSKKPKEVESMPSMSVTKEVTSWRRGQCFTNGRFVRSIQTILCSPCMAYFEHVALVSLQY